MVFSVGIFSNKQFTLLTIVPWMLQALDSDMTVLLYVDMTAAI